MLNYRGTGMEKVERLFSLLTGDGDFFLVECDDEGKEIEGICSDHRI